MKALRRFCQRLTSWTTSARDEEILRAEIEDHIARQTADNLRAGMTATEARRQALLKFGNVNAIKDIYRDQRGLPLMETLLRDVRHALRRLRRTPAFTTAVLLTLALGIGANTAIFGVVDSVLIRPLPYPHAEALVGIWHTAPGQAFGGITNCSPSMYFTYREQNRTFQQFGLWGSTGASVTGGAEPEVLRALLVTYGLLDALDEKPLLGRWFSPADDTPGSPETVILTFGYWQRRFNGDRSILGRTMTINSTAHTVIGVMPEEFRFQRDPVLILPERFERSKVNLGTFAYQGIARLKPGVTIDAARADLNRIAGQLASQYPEAKGMGVTIEPSEGWVASDSLRRALWVLMSAVGFLLLIACVNLANMLLARSTGRIRERAMRAALGASRARVIQTAVAESVLLGVLGAAIGLAIAFGAVRLLRAFDPGDIPRLSEVSIDGLVLAITLGAALLTSIITGLAPALRTPYHDIVAALREGDRSVVGNRRTVGLRGALVSVEVALSLMLLVGAGLLIRSFGAILDVDRGFQTENRVLFNVTLPNAQNEADVQRLSALRTQLQARLAALPQVKDVAAVSIGLLRGTGTGMGFAAQDKPSPPSDAVPWAGWRMITPNYFKTLGVPIVAGRDFNAEDVIARPWRVVISHRIAERLWPGESAIGRQLILWKGQQESVAEVIGVSGDMRDWDLADLPSYTVYMPFNGAGWNPSTFVVHTTAAPTAIVPIVRSMLAELSPSSPVSNVRTIDDLVGESVAARRFTMLLLGALAAVALLLALAGVYGVLSYSVSRRKTEIGMRMALGASRSSVLRLIVSQGMRPVVIGLAAGVLGAIGLSRYMASLLFGVTRLDAPTYAGVAALLTVAAVLACYLPARDAMKVDVLTALREE